MDGSEHSFSIEMISRAHIKRISVSDNPRDPIIFEGELGEIDGLQLIEGLMLEVKGRNGTLRIDMTSEEFESYCKSDACTSNVVQRCMRIEKLTPHRGSLKLNWSGFRSSLRFLSWLKVGFYTHALRKSSLFVTRSQLMPTPSSIGPFAFNQLQPCRQFTR
jgi:hypothetical protein